ncbi:carbonic anhydrase [Bosea sp. (in: a-proteobacteria)]|uniref:carbonic anhydrase n=1 Tax=Bosea sp. (in: a-proteobacteria) TaxID=1871050 RepID=UPI0011F426C1|nr:carbonic anhydrase [Bosea sp. (in: a-proteobacteria)]TAJ27998.1 MAG: carbonic anhydrase [Bosea sp. (in: a-proteobacteria)]
MDNHAQYFPRRLTEGYRSFLDDRFVREKGRYEELGENGQTPKIMLIGCCDSRVSPEVIFDARPGEMFVARNIANLVPPYQPDDQLHGTSAALEYAVQALRVEHIVVLGHGRCGGIRAFADDSQAALSPGDFIGKWITLIGPAAQRTGGRGRNESFEDYLSRLELASIQQSIENLRTFPCVKILEEKGRLQLHGAFFAVHTGVLMILDPATGQFIPAVGEMPKRVQQIRCVEG